MTTDPMDTPRCSAVAKGTGERCKRRPVPGATVCVKHGGAAPQVQAAAEQRRAEAAAEVALRRGLAAAYGDEVPDVDPKEALVAAVAWKYAEVVWLRGRVADLDESQLTWGKVRDKSGGDDYGVTQEARPHVWLSLLHEAERDLVRFSRDAVAAGIEERRIEIEQDKAALVTAAFRAALGVLSLLPADRDLAVRTFLASLGAGEVVAGEVTA